MMEAGAGWDGGKANLSSPLCDNALLPLRSDPLVETPIFRNGFCTCTETSCYLCAGMSYYPPLNDEPGPAPDQLLRLLKKIPYDSLTIQPAMGIRADQAVAGIRIFPVSCMPC